MTAEVECRYYGRSFTTEEMALLRALIAADPHLTCSLAELCSSLLLPTIRVRLSFATTSKTRQVQ